jgi:hypothetical protein
MRFYRDDGALESETHSYGQGTIKIGINFKFKAGAKIEESYFLNSRLIGRKSYEKARRPYKDMPPPDKDIEDWGGELRRRLAEEKKHPRPVVCRHYPNLDQAVSVKAFCEERMLWGKRREATAWLKSKKHALGDLSWAKSGLLVRQLLALGCAAVYACEIEFWESGEQNSRKLVMELPKDSSQRKKIFRKLNRLGPGQGFDQPADGGQRFANLTLD